MKLIFFFFNSFLAVAKALRRVSEGKASAQAEAAEWKRKYELERARNLQLERKGFLMIKQHELSVDTDYMHLEIAYIIAEMQIKIVEYFLCI